jgi:hypothetical protein
MKNLFGRLGRVSLCAVPGLALGLAACPAEETGIQLDFEPATSGAALTNGIVIAPEFEVSRFEALVSEVKLLPDKDPNEGNDGRFQAKGTFLVDVLDSANSTTPVIEVPAETYKKVELKFDKPKDDAGLDGQGWALVLDAAIGDPDNDDVYNVELRLESMDKLTLRDVDGLALSGGEVGTFLVNLDVLSWFDDVDFKALDEDGDFKVRIDKDSDKDAFESVKKQIKDNIKLLRKP